MKEEYIVGSWYTTDYLFNDENDRYLFKYLKSKVGEGKHPEFVYSERAVYGGMTYLSEGETGNWSVNNNPEDIRLATEEELRQGLPTDHPEHPDNKPTDIKDLIKDILG